MQSTMKLTKEQAVQHLQQVMAGGASLADSVKPVQPASTMSVSELVETNTNTNVKCIPPDLEDLETDETDGIYVDDAEFELAQSRVARWLELGAQISALNTAIRERRREKNDLEKHLLAWMHTNKVPHFEMSKGNLTMTVSKHKQPLNQKFITEKVQAVAGLSEDAKNALLKSIFEERNVIEKTQLKHVKSK